MTQIPRNPKIYHIAHADKMRSIVNDGFLFSDAEMIQRQPRGTNIGLGRIKERRLQLALPSFADLNVGQCVPFYFCPRSVMLYMMHIQHDELEYKGGQEPIVHLVADLRRTTEWADAQDRRWVFTLSNAASYYFEDRTDLASLSDIDWAAVNTRYWSKCREAKQSEFLVERMFPWSLIEYVCVKSTAIAGRVEQALSASNHQVDIRVKANWYYD